jgi:hypothetical protein
MTEFSLFPCFNASSFWWNMSPLQVLWTPLDSIGHSRTRPCCLHIRLAAESAACRPSTADSSCLESQPPHLVFWSWELESRSALWLPKSIHDSDTPFSAKFWSFELKWLTKTLLPRLSIGKKLSLRGYVTVLHHKVMTNQSRTLIDAGIKELFLTMAWCPLPWHSINHFRGLCSRK